MLENEGAGAEGNDGQGGSGAPSGGSPEGGSENDDKPITARQLKAALASQKKAFEDQMAAKDRELQAFKEGVGTREPAQKPKVYSRADLKAAVDGGQITQEQADDIWDRQREAQILAKAEETALQTVAGRTQKERIDSEIAAYKRLKPEIMDEGSDLREKVKAEFNYLVNELGEPGSGPDVLKTQLKAIRAALGPLDKLETASRASRSADHEQQGGGGDGRQRGGSGSSKSLYDQLNPDAKKKYDRWIETGVYKDKAAVEAELKYASPSVRQRLGLPA